MTDPTTPVARQLEAYNARDIDGFMACWAADCDYYAFPDTLLAHGAEAVRARHVERFREPDLFGRLDARVAMGNLVVDRETVTRNFPEGVGDVDVLAIYEVDGPLIRRAWFSMGPRRLRGPAT
jgi:putative hydrolase of HD superfamily